LRRRFATMVTAEATGGDARPRPSGTMEIADHLDRGDIDLAIGSLAAPGERFSDLRLFEDRFACVLAQDHPACRQTARSVPPVSPACRISKSRHPAKAPSFIDAELAGSAWSA